MRVAFFAACLAAFIPAGLAQTTLVAERGQLLPLGDRILQPLKYSVGGTGDWAACVRTDNSHSARQVVLMVNGQVVFRSADILAATGQTLGNRFDDIQINDAGSVAFIGGVRGTGPDFLAAVFVDGEIVLQDGDLIGTRFIRRIDRMDYGSDGRLSAIVTLDSYDFGAPTVLVDLDLSQSNPVPTLRIDAGFVYADGATVQSVLGVWNRGSGSGLVYAVEETATGVVRTVARTRADVVVATGDPSPFGGAPWNFSPFLGEQARFDISEGGAVAALGRINSISSADRAIAVDGQAIVRVGDTVPINGTSVVRQLDTTVFGMTKNDRPMYSVLISATAQSSDRDRVVFVGDTPVLMDGMAVLGTTVQSLIEFTSINIRPISDNGAFFLHLANLADGRSGLLLGELGLGTESCGPAVPNSTGQSAHLIATGSGLAGGAPLRLVATSLPVQQFGIFFVGDSTNSVTPPGSDGVLCIGGQLGRFNGSIASSGAIGQLEFQVDTTAIPLNPPTAIQAGETWLFQAWFRDANPTATSNFTDAVAVTFH